MLEKIIFDIIQLEKSFLLGGIMESLEIHGRDVSSYIKRIIQKYCPNIEDRLYILGNAKAPELEIQMDFQNEQTQIFFLLGNSNFKQSSMDYLRMDSYLPKEEIKNIMDYLLGDHEVIKSFDEKKQHLLIVLSINWREETIQGMECGDIHLNLNFHDREDLKREYMLFLIQQYWKKLEHLPSFQKVKLDYLERIKKDYFSWMDKEEMLSHLANMTEEELRQLLQEMNLELFQKMSLRGEESSSSKQYQLELPKNI